MSDSIMQYPISPYEVTGYGFGSRIRSRGIFIARHLGHDILAQAGTKVSCMMDGTVIWSEIRPGSAQKKNWGGIVIVEHVNADTSEKFYSVYGHIKNLKITVGQIIKKGDAIGVVAEGATPENGFWKLAHLHFGIYVGPWTGAVLPGWLRPFEGRTKLSWWKDPKVFIDTYNKALE
jgi:murein DD-endopeptidase MepM/ murein hydrolase activator NlpD